MKVKLNPDEKVVQTVKEGLKQIDQNIFFLACDAYEVSSRKK